MLLPIWQFLSSCTISTPSNSLPPFQPFHFLPKVLFSLSQAWAQCHFIYNPPALSLWKYPGILCWLHVHTSLFSCVHQPLLIFLPLFSKLSYFLLPNNDHKKSPNPHRSSPVRTNVINRVHHSEHICEHRFVSHNCTKQLCGGTRISAHMQAVTARLSPPSLPSQLTPRKSGFTAGAPTHESGNTSQRSTIMLNFNKVLLLQMKTIPFQYGSTSCAGRLVYIPACSELHQETVPVKISP